MDNPALPGKPKPLPGVGCSVWFENRVIQSKDPGYRLATAATAGPAAALANLSRNRDQKHQ
jgi:hypothetical protein